ncbi:spore germination protein [Bacillota bacterium LX-D]|nr:spore germination protein [Bacillota bacterium LX-D]
MFRKILRSLYYLKLKSINAAAEVAEKNKPAKENKIPISVAEIKIKLQNLFVDANDFVLREYSIGEKSKVKVLISFIDGLVNKKLINDHLLKPFMIDSILTKLDENLSGKNAVNFIEEYLLSTCELTKVSTFDETVHGILSGDTVLYIDGSRIALVINLRGWEMRQVAEPRTETVVRGPREGFVETIRTNTSLLRRKIKNPNLKFETLTLGKQTKTDVMICYIKGIAHEDIIATVRRRLKRINTDAILESGYIEEFIEDAPLGLFPTVGNSEKPDVVAGKLLEGRVAILCDGTPFVLTVPYLFIEAIQSSEDYYSRWVYASAIRILRLLALVITTMLPALYVAGLTFHQSVIPFKLLLTMAASRQGIPYSPFVEALLMLISFELLREAGIRLPRPVGQAISIVGALVLGEAAVQAGLASNPMVIITSITAITSFINVPLAGTIPFLRLAFLIAGNIVGLLGIMLVGLLFLLQLCAIRSFGVPYLSSFAPLSGSDLKDTLIRIPIWAMLTRPKALTWEYSKDLKYRMKIDYRQKED